MRWIGIWVAAMAAAGAMAGQGKQREAFVRVSPRDARYFELSDGRPYVPIGLNMIRPPWAKDDPAKAMAGFDAWLKKLADNGGNFVRIWCSSPFWDVEHERSGRFDETKAKLIDQALAMARERGVRVKMTLEHFRTVKASPGAKSWSTKTLHHVDEGGAARDMADWFRNAESRRRFKAKLAWYRKRYGDNPTVFGWELWNEVNATAGRGEYVAWTEAMLAELQRLFPKNLAMQSLGSFDRDGCRDVYRRVSTMKGNDVAQVHRYLDLGAQLKVCQGPVDVLAAEAVREILGYKPGRPVLLAESGAVEPRHTGPFKLYAKDKAGVILHDVLFAPFFAGAAGPGHCWHWDQYVDKNGLWHHFGRFAAVVKDLDPPAEGFQPGMLPHDRLRVYVLAGRRTVLLWCRDKKNTWRSELAEGTAPEALKGVTLELADLLKGGPPAAEVRVYDPWSGTWNAGALRRSTVTLPRFSRSIVVRIARGRDNP